MFLPVRMGTLLQHVLMLRNNDIIEATDEVEFRMFGIKVKLM